MVVSDTDEMKALPALSADEIVALSITVAMN